MLDFIIIVFIVILGFNLKYLFKKRIDRKYDKYLNGLWICHILIGYAFYLYVNSYGGDARNYWFTVKYNIDLSIVDYFSRGLGTNSMYVLTYFPSKILDLSFLTGSAIYAFIGYLGFLLYFSFFLKHIRFNSKIGRFNLFPLVLFLPNLHFWSSGVGKDTLLFFCIALFVYSIDNFRKNIILIIFSLSLAYFIRPHISFFLIASFAFAFLLDGNLKSYQKILISAVFFVIFLLLFNRILSYLKIESIDSETLSQFSESKVEGLSRSSTGSSVDISGYPLPFKILTFLYRPFFFDINGILAIVASFENLILFILTLKFFRNNPLKILSGSGFLIKGIVIFFLIGTISFSFILGNLGIMLRQKNMFIPLLIFIVLYTLSKNKELSLN